VVLVVADIMKLTINQIEHIVDEATEEMRAWVLDNQQIILTKLNQQIKHKLKLCSKKREKQKAPKA